MEHGMVRSVRGTAAVARGIEEPRRVLARRPAGRRDADVSASRQLYAVSAAGHWSDAGDAHAAARPLQRRHVPRGSDLPGDAGSGKLPGALRAAAPMERLA